MEIAHDRRGALIDQFDATTSASSARLKGLTDAEYLWEPVAGMWSVRPRGAAASPHPFGPGEWLIDNAAPDPEPVPVPVTTIAWRLGHLTSGLAGRYEYTFGGRSADPTTLVDFSPNASDALAAFDEAADTWRAGLLTLSDDQLDMTGFGQYPFGLDPQLPFIGIVWWVNRELSHHLAEIALLRDLFANRPPTA